MRRIEGDTKGNGVYKGQQVIQRAKSFSARPLKARSALVAEWKGNGWCCCHTKYTVVGLRARQGMQHNSASAVLLYLRCSVPVRIFMRMKTENKDNSS